MLAVNVQLKESVNAGDVHGPVPLRFPFANNLR